VAGLVAGLVAELIIALFPKIKATPRK
jgi:hypothetical protein